MAAAIAINNFRTITHILTTGAPEEIYTSPTGYTSVFLLIQVTNTDTVTRTCSLYHTRLSTNTEIVVNFPIPAGDTASLLPGKLVLETGDKIAISGSVGTNLKFLASVLETSNF